MGLLNLSFGEILGKMGKGIGKGAKYVGKDIWEEGVGIAKLSKDFGKYVYKQLKGTSSKFLEDIPRDKAENIFSFITGKTTKVGHVGEGPIAKKIREFEPLKFGKEVDGKRVFKNGEKVGFIPKVAEFAVNGTYQGIVNLPFGFVNKVALSPLGRIGAGIAAGGAMYGAFKGMSANSLSNVEGSQLANMAVNTTSPLLSSDEAVNSLAVGLDNHGAEGNLVFALHNLRQGG